MVEIEHKSYQSYRMELYRVDPKDKFNFNVRLNLIPSQQWVQCGAFLDLSYGVRSIVVRIDPTSLPPGVHSAV